MVEVYRVGVTLRLVDEATPALRRLIGALGVANEAVEKLRATLTDLAGTRMAGLSRSMLGVEKRLTGIADAGEQMGATVGASFDRLGIGVGALRTELAGVAAEMKGIAAESRTIRAFSAGGGGGGRGGAHVGGGLHGRVPVGPMHAGFGVVSARPPVSSPDLACTRGSRAPRANSWRCSIPCWRRAWTRLLPREGLLRPRSGRPRERDIARHDLLAARCCQDDAGHSRHAGGRAAGPGAPLHARRDPVW